MEKTAEEETEEFISNMLSGEDHKSLLEQSGQALLHFKLWWKNGKHRKSQDRNFGGNC